MGSIKEEIIIALRPLYIVARNILRHIPAGFQCVLSGQILPIVSKVRRVYTASE